MSVLQKLDFEICPISCDTLKLTDTTCRFVPYNLFHCVNGYNIPGQLDASDVDSTLLDIIMPDGTIYTNVNIGYDVATKARVELVWNTGSLGTVAIEIGGVIIGGVGFNGSPQQTVLDLITSINVFYENGAWIAWLKDGTDDTIVIESVNFGDTYNSLLTTFIASDDIVFDIVGSGPNNDLTYGANNFTDEYCFNLGDYLGIDCDDFQLQCGVYKFTYKIFDIAGDELARTTKHTLFDCCITNAIKEWILLEEDKPCCDSKMDERILEIRLLQEKAKIQFEQCMYDCSQKTINKAQKLISNICLDC